MDTAKKKIIPIEVRDEYILGSGVSIGAAGSYDAMILRIKFDDSWMGLNKYATWTNALGSNGDQTIITALDLVVGEVHTYDIPVPEFATQHAGTVKLSFTGYAIGGTADETVESLINTAAGSFRVLESNATRLDGGKVDSNIAEQLLSKVNQLNNSIEEWTDAIYDQMNSVGEAENRRNNEEDMRKSNEQTRVTNEEARVAAEEERKTQFETAQADRTQRFEGFFNDLGIAQGPGDSESRVMSQKAVTDYVPKARSKNMLDVTWQNAKLNFDDPQNENGSITSLSNGVKQAAFAEYIEAKPNTSYTISWGDTDGLNVYVYQYDSDKRFIERSVVQGRYPGCGTITTLNGCSYIRIHLFAWSNLPWKSVIPSEFQMEEGGEATQYVTPSVIDEKVIDGLKSISPIVYGVYKQILPPDVWKQDTFINYENGKEITEDTDMNYKVISNDYIQMRRGDKVYFDNWSKANCKGIICEYDLLKKDFLKSSGINTVAEYEVENDCFIRIGMRWYDPYTFDTAATGVTIIHNRGGGIRFEALPINDIIQLINKVIEKNNGA